MDWLHDVFGLGLIEKHLAWYLDEAGAAPPVAVRTAILTGEDTKAVIRLVRAALTAQPLRSAA